MKFFCHGQDLHSSTCLLSHQSPAAGLAALPDGEQGTRRGKAPPPARGRPLANCAPPPPKKSSHSHHPGFVCVPGVPRAGGRQSWEHISLLPLCCSLPYVNKGNPEATAISVWIHVMQDICWLTSPFLFAPDTAAWEGKQNHFSLENGLRLQRHPHCLVLTDSRLEPEDKCKPPLPQFAMGAKGKGFNFHHKPAYLIPSCQQ